ncbi:MAG: hypothetical protein HC800_24265 [Phormidesmis sp. RL_2_1]|nr:hypothetical protein [Phormidesmis sp. RL_2_1]
MTVQKSLWFPLVISLEVILVTLYAISVHANGGNPFPLFDVNGARTLPSWLQAIQLFLLGALPLWMCLTYRNSAVPPSRRLLAFTALLFLYASLDELLKLNFLANHHQLWKSIYLAVGLAVPILFYRDLLRLFNLHPQAMRLIGIGILIFLVCGFGLDLFRVHVQQPYWYQLFGRWKFYQVDSIRTALEELGEMTGETLVLKGMVALAQRRWSQLAINNIPH